MIQTCPVCEGKGQMPRGFYLDDYDGKSTSPVECRSCKGGGTVGIFDVIPQPYPLPLLDYTWRDEPFCGCGLCGGTRRQ